MTGQAWAKIRPGPALNLQACLKPIRASPCSLRISPASPPASVSPHLRLPSGSHRSPPGPASPRLSVRHPVAGSGSCPRHSSYLRLHDAAASHPPPVSDPPPPPLGSGPARLRLTSTCLPLLLNLIRLRNNSWFWRFPPSAEGALQTLHTKSLESRIPKSGQVPGSTATTLVIVVVFPLPHQWYWIGVEWQSIRLWGSIPLVARTRSVDLS